jgi:predicted ATP-grasp superfamily ATP-dependent carboligase
VPGGDDQVYFTLQYCDEKGTTLARFTGRKLRQWRPHCGGTASCEPAGAPELEERAAAFFEGVGMAGLCSVEYKRDHRDGAFYMIEPTVGRTDWQSAIADLNGVPLPYIAYCHLAGDPLPKWRRSRRATRWVDWRADRKAAAYYRERGELSRRAWLWSIRWPVRGAYWAFDDPGPWLAILRGTFARAWGKLRRIVSPGPAKESVR